MKKTRDLTSKVLANEIKENFDIDINPAFVRRILIKFDHESKMKQKKMLLTAALKKKRLQWECHHQNWSFNT